ncbi:MAG: hypothetical protein E6K45_09180 [Gammaproteobacteria bacterium]|nr:MAG: hypothetical protein E6K45_09180 [Gammaproteobacteria bacterium]
MLRSLPGLSMCLALTACGQHGAAPSEQSGAPPAIAYEAHLAAGVGVPAGATLRNPHESSRR